MGWKKFNKKFGVYYTPREIVYYMARKSLIYYLNRKLKIPAEYIEALLILEDLDELKDKFPKAGKEIINKKREIVSVIKDLKIVDPAVGSGAFPMGILHELIAKRFSLGDKTDITDMKKDIIQNKIGKQQISPSMLTLYLGFDKPLKDLGNDSYSTIFFKCVSWPQFAHLSSSLALSVIVRSSLATTLSHPKGFKE